MDEQRVRDIAREEASAALKAAQLDNFKRLPGGDKVIAPLLNRLDISEAEKDMVREYLALAASVDAANDAANAEAREALKAYSRRKTEDLAKLLSDQGHSTP